MRKTDSGFSIVDFLIIVAMLLIVLGMIGPRVARNASKPNPSKARPAATRTVR